MPAAINLTHGLLLIACLLVAGGLFLRRAGRRTSRPPEPTNVASRASRILLRIDESEARLYDFARSLDAEHQTRMAALRMLIEEADRVTTRLELLLTETQDRTDLLLLPTDEHSRAARSLKQAGYSDEQIEKLLQRADEDPNADRVIRRAA